MYINVRWLMDNTHDVCSVRKAVSSSGTIVRENRRSQAVRRLLDSSSEIVAKSRDTAKE